MEHSDSLSLVLVPIFDASLPLPSLQSLSATLEFLLSLSFAAYASSADHCCFDVQQRLLGLRYSTNFARFALLIDLIITISFSSRSSTSPLYYYFSSFKISFKRDPNQDLVQQSIYPVTSCAILSQHPLPTSISHNFIMNTFHFPN